MKLKKYDAMLRKYQLKQEIVKIERNVTKGEANIYGLISGLTKRFMHISENDGFRFNGEIIIRMDHFDSIRCRDFDKTIKRILKAEKQLTNSKPKSEKKIL